jgi:hypothetical protein
MEVFDSMPKNLRAEANERGEKVVERWWQNQQYKTLDDFWRS